MLKKFLMILIPIMIIFIIFIIIYTKDSKKMEYKNKKEKSDIIVKTDYDEETGLYYIEDKENGNIIQVSNDKTDLQFYEENPDYNPNPLQTKSTNIKDYILSSYTNETIIEN